MSRPAWKTVVAGELANERTGSVDPSKFSDEIFDLYSIPSYDVGEPEVLAGRDIGSSKKIVKPGDILISKIIPHIRRVWIVGQNRGRRQIASGEWISFGGEDIHPNYLRYFLLSDGFHTKFMSTITGVGGSLLRARPSEVYKIEIPLPPLETQKHIARVLEQADQLRKQAQQMESELNQLAQSLFLEMFGDPVTNPKNWRTATLGSLVDVTSGGTPSKSNKRFWQGAFPWVSPKDMKSIEISDAIDHINECVFEETNIKRIDEGNILIVVRGMILVHTVPIAITTAPVAINQDIKSMRVVDENIAEPRYLLACLTAMHEKLLGIVSTAAHGTKRIETTDLSTLTVPIPPKELQNDYCKVVFVLREQVEAATGARNHYENLFQALMQRAFKGELIAPSTKAA